MMTGGYPGSRPTGLLGGADFMGLLGGNPAFSGVFGYYSPAFGNGMYSQPMGQFYSGAPVPMQGPVNNQAQPQGPSNRFFSGAGY